MVTENNPYLGQDYAEVFRTLKKEHNIILIGISKKELDGSRQLLKNPREEIPVKIGDYLIMIMSGDKEAPITDLFGVAEGFISDS